MKALFWLTVALIAARLFLSPWIIMLLVGVLHSMHPQVPALGFWTCFIGTMIISIATYQASSSKGD